MAIKNKTEPWVVAAIGAALALFAFSAYMVVSTGMAFVRDDISCQWRADAEYVEPGEVAAVRPLDAALVVPEEVKAMTVEEALAGDNAALRVRAELADQRAWRFELMYRIAKTNRQADAQTIADALMRETLRHGIEDRFLLYRIAKVESHFRYKVKSHAGARGVMQVMYSAHAGDLPYVRTAGDLYDIYANVRAGADIYVKYLGWCDGDTACALKRYNGSYSNEAAGNRYLAKFEG